MGKLKLELDELAVESFDTSATDPQHGTVRGHETDGDPYTCGGETCMGGQQTCWDSCDTVCGSYYCATAEASCGQGSCVYTCTSCNVFGCTSC